MYQSTDWRLGDACAEVLMSQGQKVCICTDIARIRVDVPMYELLEDGYTKNTDRTILEDSEKNNRCL